MGRGDAKVLDYGDVLLRQQDVELLEGPHWLNDQVISFWFEYLSREAYAAGSALCTSGNHDVGAGTGAAAGGLLLLPPGTSFLLMHAGPHMAAEVLAPLQPSRCSVVAMAVNDNDDPEAAAGGSHWSLLVFHRPSTTMRHYDSSPGAGNARAARRLVAAVGPALMSAGDGRAAGGGAGGGTGGGGGGGSGGSGRTGAAPAPRYVEVSTPSQTNSYDCGVYVLAVARAVCEWHGQEQQQLLLLQGRQQGHGEGCGGRGTAAEGQGGGEWAGWEVAERRLGSWLTPGSVAALRREVLQLVRSKAAEQRGRRG